jgi:hypothetical protein
LQQSALDQRADGRAGVGLPHLGVLGDEQDPAPWVHADQAQHLKFRGRELGQPGLGGAAQPDVGGRVEQDLGNVLDYVVEILAVLG